jgi:hypothetical protein
MRNSGPDCGIRELVRSVKRVELARGPVRFDLDVAKVDAV